MHDPLIALDADVNGHAHQNERIHKRRQHTGALITERLPVVGRLPLEVESDPGQDQRRNVGEVVPRIADERQAVSDRARHKLGRDQRQRHPERYFDCPARRGWVKMVVVLVSHSTHCLALYSSAQPGCKARYPPPN